MTPDHKTDTLEGLIERWRWAASLGKVTKDPAIAAQQAGWAQCADELAPILAGLRDDLQDLEDTANEISVNAEGRAYRNALRVCVSRVRKRLVRHTAVADQKAKGKERDE